MNRKTINKVNGGIAIYYGIGSIVGAIAGIISICVWLFQVFTDSREFEWGTLVALTIITAVLGLIGYAITRVGYEQIEK